MKPNSVLLNRHNLACAAMSSQEETRYALSAVQISPNETVACDGYALVRVTLIGSNGDFRPLLLKTRHAKQLLGALDQAPDKTADVEIGSDSEGIVATLLDARYHFEAAVGTFPDFETVMPKGEPVAKIKFTPAKFLRLLAFLAELDDHSVTISFYDTAGKKPVKFEASNGDQQAVALLMPAR